MIINHPLLGPRDISEFVYLGDASLLKRPTWDNNKSEEKPLRLFFDFEKTVLFKWLVGAKSL